MQFTDKTYKHITGTGDKHRAFFETHGTVLHGTIGTYLFMIMVSGESLSSQKGTGNSSRIRIPDPEKIHPGSRG
jgi:hypothetical protein